MKSSFQFSKILFCFIFLILFHLSLVTAVYAEPPKRIISLAPNMTEILFAMGLGDRIVGITNFCDYPEEAKKKQKIGGMSNPSLEAVVSLKPDIVVMTTDGNPKEFEERLHSLKIRTYVFKARRLLELPGGIRDLGTPLGVKNKADELAKEIEVKINKLAVGKNSKLRKILFIVWPEPLIVAGPGTAIDDAITVLGYENIASKAKASYPKYSIEEIIRQSPDVIFIGRGHVNMKEVSKGLLKRLAIVPAVKNGSVFYVSDSLYRLGPRVINGIEEIADCLIKR
jgi:iron complex transport system substrate-binding protein